jgi:hypothetical protein
VLATLITILVVLATLTILLMNGACTQCFVGKPPQGQAAMGLVVPFFGLGGAVLVMGLAGLLACFRISGSALGQIHSSPTVAGLIVVVVTFGAALAAGMAFMLWCEPVSVSLALRAATVPLCIALGLVGPVVLAVALLTGLWTTRDTLAANPGSAVPLRVLFWAVVALAVAGYAMGGSLLWKSLALQAANQAAALKNELERQAERLAHANKPVEQRFADELAGFSSDSPLWPILSYLPTIPGQQEPNDAARAVVIKRALQAPDFDAGLRDCMEGQYYLYRQGGAELLRHVDEQHLASRQDAWGEILIAGVRTTTEGIECRPAWLTETFDSKPDPLGHVESLLGAAKRFEQWSGYPRLREQFEQMARAAADLNPGKDRDKLIKMLAKAGFSAREASGAR